jgi:hypothetical protein
MRSNLMAKLLKIKVKKVVFDEKKNTSKIYFSTHIYNFAVE